MENENIEQVKVDNSMYTHFIGVKFEGGARAYFFGVTDSELLEGDKVIVETVRGMELGEILIAPIAIEKYTAKLQLKGILRKANDTDVKIHDVNIKDAQQALKICEEEVSKLKLDMRLISAEYTLDRSKVCFTYLADERVDFRELLKVLAARLHTRIDLKQVGSRDKAKMVGGLGQCGLKLCCSSFLNEFDGISINRAKNQMLAINIPKLSGQCGKLMCCLKYEDDCYTEAKKYYPELDTNVSIDDKQYKVVSVNVISRVVTLFDGEEYLNLPLNEFKKQTGQLKEKEVKDDKPNVTQNDFKNNRDNNRDENRNNNFHRPNNNQNNQPNNNNQNGNNQHNKFHKNKHHNNHKFDKHNNAEIGNDDKK